MDPEHSPQSGKTLCVCVLYDGWLNENPALLTMGGQCSECQYISSFIETGEKYTLYGLLRCLCKELPAGVGDMRDMAAVPVSEDALE